MSWILAAVILTTGLTAIVWAYGLAVAAGREAPGPGVGGGRGE